MPRYIVEMPCLVLATIEVEARDAEQATQYASDRIKPEHVTVIQATESNRAHADRCCMSPSQLAQACKEIAAGKR